MKLIAQLLLATGMVLGLVVSPTYSPASAATNVCETPEDELTRPLVEPVEICGTTVLEGSEPSVVSIEVLTTITISESFGPGQPIEIDGDGEFVGFALVEDAPRFNGFRLIAGRLPDGGGSVFLGSGVCSPCTITPGRYLLYLLADGSPATVTLRIPELTGNVTLRPRTAITYDAGLLTPRVASDDVMQVRTWGDTANLASEGLLFVAVWSTTSSLHAVGHQRICASEGEPVVYPPECNPGLSQDGNRLDPATGSFFHRTYGTWQVNSGTYALQGSLTKVGDVTGANALGVWLSFA